MDRFDDAVNGWIDTLDQNEYVSSALALFLILYAGLAAPKLPEYIARLFGSTLFKFLIIFLIAYSARSNPTIALIAAIGLMVSLQTLNRYDMNRAIMSHVVQEQAEAFAQEEAMRHMEEAQVGHIEATEEVHAMAHPEEVHSMIHPEEVRSMIHPEEVHAMRKMEEAQIGSMGATQVQAMAHPEESSHLSEESRIASAPTCTKTMNWRNSFYPQYVNMKPDAYMARYNGQAVRGYDPRANNLA